LIFAFYRMKHVIIIGGGLSGTLCAINLLKQDTLPLKITLIEKNKHQLLKGTAYSSMLPHQLLNVPVSAMSLLESEPDHFYAWLSTQEFDAPYTPSDFVPRDIYGRYIQETFASVRETSSNTLDVEIAAVTLIQEDNGKYTVVCRDKHFEADQVIICTGNLPPQHIPNLDPACLYHAYYIQNPWAEYYLSEMSTSDDVLLVGTGLTMVDQVMSLNRSGHKGKISLVSRRGLLPLPHGAAPQYTLKLEDQYDLTTVLGCLKWLRAEVALAESEGATWISVIMAMRDMAADLWAGFSDWEKAAFLRHLRPYWEVHRHRVPKENAEIMKTLMDQGKVVKYKGRIDNVKVVGNEFHTTILSRSRLEKINITTKWLINCTGPHPDITKSRDVLLNNLLQKGILDTDALSIGLVISKGQENLFLVGPPAKGTYWECTALREIRKHAGEVTEQIINGNYADARLHPEVV
jgi:uncharacterized NAD(P)/FAD-binding protein YdhS